MDNIPLILAAVVLLVLYLCKCYKSESEYYGSGSVPYGAVSSSGNYTFF